MSPNITAAVANGLNSSIHAVEVQITILKQLLKNSGNGAEENEEEEETPPAKKSKKATTFEDESEDEAPPAKKKKAASFDDAEEEEETPPAKKTKAPKLTVDDVNDACMTRAGNSNRAEVLGILKKNFKVKSVTDLDPSDFAECIKLMNSNKS